jgi:flagellar biosynthetic protein FliR
MLDTFLLILSRVIAFVSTAPVIGRKDLAFNIKIAFALYVTIALLWTVPVSQPGAIATGYNMGLFLLHIGVNATIGLFLGFLANLVMLTINTCGSIINTQIGLSQAMMMDPSTKVQTQLLDPLFGMLGMMLFLYLDGMAWLLSALQRSFTMFPLYQVRHDLPHIISYDAITQLISNTVVVGVELVAPIFLVTILLDVMLGVINRTAQQMPVFQLSSALKPAIGLGLMMVTMPHFLAAARNYLQDHARFF